MRRHRRHLPNLDGARRHQPTHTRKEHKMTSPLLAELMQYRRKENRRKEAAAGCVTSIVAGFVRGLFGGWMLMLAVGIAHSHWIQELPTIGYWTSATIVYLLHGVFSHLDIKKESS
jgi:hypothetical protein